MAAEPIQDARAAAAAATAGGGSDLLSRGDIYFSRASLPSLSAAHAGTQYSLKCTRLEPVVVVPIKTVYCNMLAALYELIKCNRGPVLHCVALYVKVVRLI